MKKHTRVYLDAMGYDETDFIPCEMCAKQAVDIHHIHARGMGGSHTKDYIENMMALCRACHLEYGDKKHHRVALVERHWQVMQERNVNRQHI
jgi:hypothetical protein